MVYGMGKKKIQPKFPRFNFVATISAWTTQWQNVIQEFGPKINLVSLGYWYFKIHILYTNLEHFFLQLWAVFCRSQHLTFGGGNLDHQKWNREGPASLTNVLSSAKQKFDGWCQAGWERAYMFGTMFGDQWKVLAGLHAYKGLQRLEQSDLYFNFQAAQNDRNSRVFHSVSSDLIPSSRITYSISPTFRLDKRHRSFIIRQQPWIFQSFRSSCIHRFHFEFAFRGWSRVTTPTYGRLHWRAQLKQLLPVWKRKTYGMDLAWTWHRRH